MMRSTNVIAALALLCASYVGAVDVHSQVYEYSVDHAVTYVRPLKIAFPDNHFMYMYCMNTDMPYVMTCNMTMVMADGNQVYCNNTKFMEPETRQIHMNIPMMFKRMGHNIVFEWFSGDMVNGYPYQYKKVSIIDMHKCSVHHLDFPIDKMDWPNHQLVVYHNMFDVYVTSKVLCGNMGQCIMRYNSNGEQIGQPISFASKYASIYSLPVSYHHPEKGAYFAGVEWILPGGIMHATHVSHSGVQTDLFTVPMKDASIMKRWQMMGSSEHQLYGLCYVENPEVFMVHCVQYDMMGHKMMDTMVEIENNHVIIGAYNMMHGGMMLMHRGCGGAVDCTSVNVTMIHMDGHVDMNVVIPEVEYHCVSPSLQLVVDHVKTVNQHCFHFGCANVPTTGMSTFKHIIKCIDVHTQ